MSGSAKRAAAEDADEDGREGAAWADERMALSRLSLPPTTERARRQAEAEMQRFERLSSARVRELHVDVLRRQQEAEARSEETMDEVLALRGAAARPPVPLRRRHQAARRPPGAASGSTDAYDQRARDRARFLETESLGQLGVPQEAMAAFGRAMAEKAAADAAAHRAQVEKEAAALAAQASAQARATTVEPDPTLQTVPSGAASSSSSSAPLGATPVYEGAPSPVAAEEEEEEEQEPPPPGMLPSDLLVGNSAFLADDTFESLDGTEANIAHAGASEAAQAVWRRWIANVNLMRVHHTRAFLLDRALQEDLVLGPRDEPRLFHAGFKRRGANDRGVDPNEICWTVVVRKEAGGTDKQEHNAASLLALLEANPALSFHPERVRRELRGGVEFKQAPQRSARGNAFAGGAFASRRNALRIVEEEGDSGLAAVVPRGSQIATNWKWARKEDGTLVVVDGKPKVVPKDRRVRRVTQTVRIVWVPIRLNETHWESCYWRELKNLEMFEPAHMTPYLHNAEFGSRRTKERISNMEFSDSAVPLLTPGSMNFYGVDLGHLPADDVALALATLAECTATNVATLPKIDLAAVRGGQALRDQLRGEVAVGPPGQQPPVVAYFLSADGARPTWRTVFRVGAPGTIGAIVTYHQNFYRVRTAAVRDKFGSDGYRGVEDDDALRERLGPARFRGRPIYKVAGATTVADDARGRDGQKELLDVRICSYKYADEEGHKGSAVNSPNEKWYSELYRSSMWRPLPLRSLRTLPDAAAAFRPKADALVAQRAVTPQLPAYLNMHHDGHPVDWCAPPIDVPADGATEAERAEAELLARLCRDAGPNYALLPGARDAARAAGWQDDPGLAALGLPPRPGWRLRANLGQRYPETTLWRRGAIDERASTVSNFFMRSRGARARRGDEAFAWFCEGGARRWEAAATPAERAERNKKWAQELDKTVHTRMLAPATLRDALRRYVFENSKAMAWFAPNADASGVRTPLRTTPLGVDAPAGVYFGCRFDVGTRPGEGGLDAFFPCSKDADVYTIADVMLARGVHDYLREPPRGGGGGGSADDDPRADPRDDRAGPPAWWAEEEAKAASLAAPFESDFDRDLDARMDGAQAWPAKDRGAAGPAKLRFANGATETMPNKNQFESKYGFGSLVFDDFTPPHVDAAAAAAALPHRTDRAMERHPLYFERLSQTSQNSVWWRWLALERSWEHCRANPDVPFGEVVYPDRRSDAERLQPGERGFLAPRGGAPADDLEPPPEPAKKPEGKKKKGKNTSTQVDAERARGSLSTLVAPCYVLALDYDDFMQAVEKVEADWSAYFEQHPVFWKEFDMYDLEAIETARGRRYILVPNTDYRLPTEVVPPRLQGRWATFDGPPEVRDESCAASYVPAALAFSVRPAERMRLSWLEQKKRFGALPNRDDGKDPREELKREVAAWEAAHAAYVADLGVWRSLEATDAELERRNEALRFHSLRLSFNVGRLLEEPFSTLFDEDDAHAHARRPRRPGVAWAYRLSAAIFLLDTVDHAEAVRVELEWHAAVHAQLRAKEGDTEAARLRRRAAAAAAAPGNPLPFVDDLLACELVWAGTDAVDAMLSKGARRVTELLFDLTKLGETWAHVAEVANRLLGGFPGAADGTAADAAHRRILGTETDGAMMMLIDAAAWDDRYGVAEGLVAELHASFADDAAAAATLAAAAQEVGGLGADEHADFPLQVAIVAMRHADADDDDRAHPLQSRMRPFLLALCDAWIDHLVQLEVVGGDAAAAVPAALRPAALRTPRAAGHYASDAFGVRTPTGVGPRDGFADLQAVRALIGFAPNRRLTYELEVTAQTILVLNERANSVRRRGLKFDPAVLPFDTDRALLESTANVVSRVYVFCQQEGSIAETIWKLLHGAEVDGPDRAALRAAVGALEGRLAEAEQAGTTVVWPPQAVLVGAGLLLELLKRGEPALESEAAQRERNRARLAAARRGRRLRALLRLAKVTQRAQVLASQAYHRVRDERQANAAPVARITAVEAGLERTRDQTRALANRALALVLWVKEQANQGLLEQLEAQIRARVRAERDTAKRRRRAAADVAMEEEEEEDDAMEAEDAAAAGSADQRVIDALDRLQDGVSTEEFMEDFVDEVGTQVDVDAALEAGVNQLPVSMLDAWLDDASPERVGRFSEAVARRADAVLGATEAIVEALGGPALQRMSSEDVLGGFQGGGTSSSYEDGALRLPEALRREGKKALFEQLVRTKPEAEAGWWAAALREAEAGAIDARTDELHLVEQMRWAYERRQRVLDVYVHFLGRTPDLAALNASLATVEPPPRLGARAYADVVSGRLPTGPTNSAEIPAAIHRWAVHGWEGGYRHYLASLLRVRAPPPAYDEVWTLDEAPLTPRQWLNSAARGAYAAAPNDPDPADEAKDEGEPKDEDLDRRIALALAPTRLAPDGPAAARLRRAIGLQRAAVDDGRPLRAPFAHGYEAAISKKG